MSTVQTADPVISTSVFTNAGRRFGRPNAWLVLVVVVLAGWLVSSLLMGLQMHPFTAPGFYLDASHPWYVPLLIAAALLVARKRMFGQAYSLTRVPESDGVVISLPPDTWATALEVTDSETMMSLLVALRRQSRPSQQAADLATSVGRERNEVEQALGRLAEIGLVEKRHVCGMDFYRVARDGWRLRQIVMLLASQEAWLKRSGELATGAGDALPRPRLLHSDESEPSGAYDNPAQSFSALW